MLIMPLLLMAGRLHAGVHGTVEHSRRAHRRSARWRRGAAGGRVSGRFQPAGGLPGAWRAGDPVRGSLPPARRVGPAAAPAAATPGRAGMVLAGRAGRGRPGRMQRAADHGHPGRQPGRSRDRHRGSAVDHHDRRPGRCWAPAWASAAWPGPGRCRHRHRWRRHGPARRRDRGGLEPAGAAAVNRGTCRGGWYVTAGRAAAAPARRAGGHDLRLRAGRRPAARRGDAGLPGRRPAGSAPAHRNRTGRAAVSGGGGHRGRVRRLVLRGRTPGRGTNRAVQRTGPHRVPDRCRRDRYRHRHRNAACRCAQRAGRGLPRPDPARRATSRYPAAGWSISARARAQAGEGVS